MPNKNYLPCIQNIMSYCNNLLLTVSNIIYFWFIVL
jgi:hypothetical protein